MVMESAQPQPISIRRSLTRIVELSTTNRFRPERNVSTKKVAIKISDGRPTVNSIQFSTFHPNEIPVRMVIEDLLSF